MKVENSANSIVQVSHKQGLTAKRKSASKKVVRNIEIELVGGEARGMKRKYAMKTKSALASS